MITQELHTDQLFASLDETTSELIQLATSISETLLNTVPFAGSWTAAQLIIHVTKSNKAIAQGLNIEGKQANRNPEDGVPHIKKMFLDFEAKYQSPAFIVPEEGNYNKDEIIDALKKSVQRLQQLRTETNLTELINLPAFGEITKLELLHFVLYHTQRHIYQLKNIITSFK
ncbi:MAG: DinB family protein [Parafilimonas sp.]